MKQNFTCGLAAKYKLHLYDAAFYLAAFFMLGIAAASFGINGYIILFSSVFIAVILYFIHKNKELVLIVLLIPFGAFYYNFYAVSHKPIVPLDENVTLTAVINDEPQERSNGQSFTVSLMKPMSGTVEIYLPAYPRFQYGDLVKLSGKVQESIYTGRPNIIRNPMIEVVALDRSNSFQAFLFKIKDSLTANIDKVLPADKSALAKGIIFGERAEFTPEFTAALKKSGTTHIVALSGYNVAIIGFVLSGICSFLWGRRRAFWITIIFIVLFVLMTGAEASVVRAAVMGTVLLVAERASRLYSFRNAITLTAAAMLLINPTLLVFNAGFELSFAALLGMVLVGPTLSKWLKADAATSFLNWRKSLAETTAAQIGALPVSLALFGSFAPLAPFSNMLVLEFIPATMFFGFMTAVLGYISSGLSLTVGWLANMFLGYEIFIINLFGTHFS